MLDHLLSYSLHSSGTFDSNNLLFDGEQDEFRLVRGLKKILILTFVAFYDTTSQNEMSARDQYRWQKFHGSM